MILKSYVPLRSDRVVLRTAQRVFRGVAQPRNELGGRNLGASAQWEEEIGSCEHTFRTDDRGESARKVSERRSGVQSSQKRTQANKRRTLERKVPMPRGKKGILPAEPCQNIMADRCITFRLSCNGLYNQKDTPFRGPAGEDFRADGGREKAPDPYRENEPARTPNRDDGSRSCSSHQGRRSTQNPSIYIERE